MNHQTLLFVQPKHLTVILHRMQSPLPRTVATENLSWLLEIRRRPTTAARLLILRRRFAERSAFGMPVQLSEQEKRNSRAERFGIGDAIKKSEDHKRKAIAERFGLNQSVPAAEEDKKKARLARFAPVLKTDSVEEDRMKARALRFSDTLSSMLQANGKGVEWKAGIMGKAGGGD